MTMVSHLVFSIQHFKQNLFKGVFNYHLYKACVADKMLFIHFRRAAI